MVSLVFFLILQYLVSRCFYLSLRFNLVAKQYVIVELSLNYSGCVHNIFNWSCSFCRQAEQNKVYAIILAWWFLGNLFLRGLSLFLTEFGRFLLSVGVSWFTWLHKAMILNALISLLLYLRTGGCPETSQESVTQSFSSHTAKQVTQASWWVLETSCNRTCIFCIAMLSSYICFDNIIFLHSTQI